MNAFRKLISVLLATLMIPSTISLAYEPDSFSAASQVENTVETFLEDCLDISYHHEEQVPLQHTLLTAPASLSGSGQTLSAAAQELASVGAELPLFQQMERTNMSLQTMSNDLSLQEDITAFYGALYEMEDVTYSNFESDYLFNDISVNGDYAAVDVTLVLNYQYSDCDQPTYEEIRYNLTLMKLNGSWYIADVASDDPMFQQYYQGGFDLESAVQGCEDALENSDLYEPVLSEQNIAVPMTTSDITYNKQNAINYALTYTTSTDTGEPSFKNDLFHWFDADCMNFASQCVWAGFGGSNYSADVQSGYGMDKDGSNTGNTAWWANATTGTNSWASCRNFRLYVQNSTNASDKGMTGALNAIAYNSNSLGYPASTLLGSVLHVKGYSNGSPVAGGHAVFVNAATGNSRSEVYYCAYNNTAKNKRLSLSFPASTTDTYQSVTIVVPLTMRNGETGTRMWADLLNVVVDRTIYRKLTGYANKELDSIQMVIYNPNSVPVMDYTWHDTDAVSANFNGFNMSGEWRVKLVGTDSSGDVTTFYYTVRVT